MSTKAQGVDSSGSTPEKTFKIKLSELLQGTGIDGFFIGSLKGVPTQHDTMRNCIMEDGTIASIIIPKTMNDSLLNATHAFQEVDSERRMLTKDVFFGKEGENFIMDEKVEKYCKVLGTNPNSFSMARKITKVLGRLEILVPDGGRFVPIADYYDKQSMEPETEETVSTVTWNIENQDYNFRNEPF